VNRTIFVFGSNLAGRHGAGSALEAMRNHGAVRGVAEGLTGDAYAIPTKDQFFRTLPLKAIKGSVDKFIVFAGMHQDWTFNVVAIGCGLAGYLPTQIAPMFKGATSNVKLPKEFDLGRPVPHHGSGPDNQ
jgi:hypothetical protein